MTPRRCCLVHFRRAAGSGQRPTRDCPDRPQTWPRQGLQRIHHLSDVTASIVVERLQRAGGGQGQLRRPLPGGQTTAVLRPAASLDTGHRRLAVRRRTRRRQRLDEQHGRDAHLQPADAYLWQQSARSPRRDDQRGAADAGQRQLLAQEGERGD